MKTYGFVIIVLAALSCTNGRNQSTDRGNNTNEHNSGMTTPETEGDQSTMGTTQETDTTRNTQSRDSVQRH